MRRASRMVPESGATLLAVIASLLWTGVLSRAEPSSFRWQLGDVATWVLAVLALLAFIAAWLAYQEQRKAGKELARQATALAAQVEQQRQALDGQQTVNTLQARVLEQQLSVLVRQQAELIGLTHGTYSGEPTGLKSAKYHRADVTNESGRPVRNVIAMLQTQQGGDLYPARNVGQIVERMMFKPAHDGKFRLLRRYETWAFIFPVESDSQAILTLRFTDDAGLHWQLDNDLHLAQLDSRDW
jgi:hypothetical protein